MDYSAALLFFLFPGFIVGFIRFGQENANLYY
jgi:hypothetical protein